jgi:hypothetical protein
MDRCRDYFCFAVSFAGLGYIALCTLAGCGDLFGVSLHPLALRPARVAARIAPMARILRCAGSAASNGGAGAHPAPQGVAASRRRQAARAIRLARHAAALRRAALTAPVA